MFFTKSSHVDEWEPIKAFYKTYKYTGFMRYNLVYISIKLALKTI